MVASPFSRAFSFVAAGGLMFLFAIIAGFGRRWITIGVASFLAGGAFFLPMFGFAEPLYLTPAINWLHLDGLSGLLWKSVLVPSTIVLITIPYPHLRWIGTAFCAAWTMHFVGTLLANPLGYNLWLIANLSLSFGMGLFSAMIHRVMGADNGKISR